VAELLTSLKDVRKIVRHRAAVTAQQWLDDNFWAAAVALEELAPAARTDT
jgi:hypothetical protein